MQLIKQYVQWMVSFFVSAVCFSRIFYFLSAFCFPAHIACRLNFLLAALVSKVRPEQNSRSRQNSAKITFQCTRPLLSHTPRWQFSSILAPFTPNAKRVQLIAHNSQSRLRFFKSCTLVLCLFQSQILQF